MRNILVIIFLGCISLSSLAKAPHPFYVSITELTIKNDTLQISIRVFSDDLETALKERNADSKFLETDKASFEDFKRISSYLEATFSVSHAAKPLKIDWLGHEFEDDVCWVYGDVPLETGQSILFIMNKLLMEVHEGQQNLIHYNNKDGVETEIATKSRKEVRFSLAN